jgi:hypothetical protein
MPVLGPPQGLFSLHHSDRCVGSMFSKLDIMEILGVSEADLAKISFDKYDGVDAIDERLLQARWYSNDAIPNAPPCKIGNATISLDEIVLKKLILIAYPEATIVQQIPWGKKRIDLKVTLGGESKLIEFLGPFHFALGPFGKPRGDPRIRKKKAENHFGIECVIWPYWIQRCVRNVHAIFDQDIEGLGALWGTNYHFGSFVFEDSAELIDELTDRFRANRDGYGYFYGPNTRGRTNPEHPIVKRIQGKKAQLATLLPRGYMTPERWLPLCLIE